MHHDNSRDNTRVVDPFTTHRFLSALEISGSVGAKTGWHPVHLVAWEEKENEDKKLVAIMPCYIKTHSQGEYIFDHDWAAAYEQAGGNYYPKIQSAVPFTPVTGRRICVKAGYEALAVPALIEAAQNLARDNGFSSFHMTFCHKDDTAGAPKNLMHRKSQQFHWFNKNYKGFDDFLADLSANKRKNIRKERKEAQAFGGQIHLLTGSAIKQPHWDAFWQFYQDTGARKWGQPYLTRDFFTQAQAKLRDDILLIMAEKDGQWCAGALHFIGSDCLYGRYWGESSYHPCLHFELCYYCAIDYAIEHGLGRIEAGAQGGHKLARGYLPQTTQSLHWFVDEDFGAAVARYVQAEGKMIEKHKIALANHAPFRKVE